VVISARIIYLNMGSYAGLYRVNKQGLYTESFIIETQFPYLPQLMCQRLCLRQAFGPEGPLCLRPGAKLWPRRPLADQVQAGKSPPRGIAGQDRSNWSTTSIWTTLIFSYDYKKTTPKKNETRVEGGKDLVRKTGDSRPCSMPLGSLLLSSIGKSGAILTIYMALHQAVRTTGKSTESRPPTSARPAMPSNKMSYLSRKLLHD